MNSFQWQGLYGGIILTSLAAAMSVYACLRVAALWYALISVCRQILSTNTARMWEDEMKKKRGFAIKLPGIIYGALYDVPAKQIWWHWFDR